jgi:FAD/FMN-containing dehydrogenase
MTQLQTRRNEMSIALTPDVSELRARMDGHVVVPGDAEWDVARQAWNLAVDQRPAAVALPESADDVIAVVEYARAHGLRVAAQGTGHNAAPLGPLDDTVLVKTSRMRGVRVDPRASTVRVEAGVLWQEATNAAAEHGLAALAGSSPDVGVVGYSLGGGISWLARKHGLSANSVVAVEIVTADGRLVRADSEHEAELFWAVRGGGGSFGVVTALELRLFPIKEVYAGVLFFPLERASEVLHAWRTWVDGVPDEVTSVGRILQFPPIPDLPDFLSGRSFAVVEANSLLGEDETARLLEPLRALGPEIDTFATIPASSLSKLHMDPEQPVPGIGDGMMLADLTGEGIDAFVTAAAGSALLSAEIRHLGGALARSAPHHGAADKLDAGFIMFAVGIPMNAEIAAAIEEGIDEVKAALEPWRAETMYMNFSERQIESKRLLRAGNYRRARRVKAAVDPTELFRSNHPIPPAEARPDRRRPVRANRPRVAARRPSPTAAR